MNVKRYIGEDITACMAQVREELGVEAFILNQRTIRRKGLLGWLQKPLVEVVAAYEPKEEKKAPRPAPRYALSDPVFPPPPEALPAREDSPPRPAAASPAPAAISPKEAHAAAMSVLERIAAKNAVDAAPSPPAPREDRFPRGERPPREGRPPRESRPPREAPPLTEIPSPAGSGASGEEDASKSPAAGGVPTAPAAISAYSPHQLKRAAPSGGTAPRADAAEKAAVPDAPAPAPADDGGESFLPAILPLIREEPEPARQIQDISNLESKLDALSTTLGTLVNRLQISKDVTRGSYPAAVEELLLSLIENDVHEEFAHKLAREAAEIIHRQNADARDVLEQLVRQTIGEPAPLKMRRFQRTVAMLVGPTGVGKTTTLAKLAAIYQLNHHAKVGVITTDTFRIAAVQQLRTYAEILEVPLSVVYAPADIADALRDHEDKDIVLIDTAGKSPGDSTLETEITELIKHSGCDEVHLVLSATTGFTGLLNIINTYSFLREYKVLFTKLDETPSWGMLLNTKFLTDKPISYVAAGQTVPDDIEVAAPRKIVDRLLGR